MITLNEVNAILKHRIINALTISEIKEIKPEVKAFGTENTRELLKARLDEIRNKPKSLPKKEKRDTRQRSHLVYGEMLTVRDASEKYKLTISVLRSRMYCGGMTLEQAVSAKGITLDSLDIKYSVNGKMLTIREAASMLGMGPKSLRSRMYKKECSLEVAFNMGGLKRKGKL